MVEDVIAEPPVPCLRLSSDNIVSMGYWMQNEAGHPPYGIVGANNPINVS